MKNWKVTAELFMNASRVESVVVRCNTERKAEINAIKEFTKKYPNIMGMIRVRSITEVKE